MRRQDKDLQPNEDLVVDDSDWVVYWLDGYSSHLTLDVLQLCELNHIHLYCFKAHASHICQRNDWSGRRLLVLETIPSISNIDSTWIRSATSHCPGETDYRCSYCRIQSLYPWNPDAVHHDNLTPRRRQLQVPTARKLASCQSTSSGHCHLHTMQRFGKTVPYMHVYRPRYMSYSQVMHTCVSMWNFF